MATNIFLQLLYPTSLSVLCLLAAVALRSRRPDTARVLFWSGIALPLICGNGWLVDALGHNLESRHLPPNPLPKADCILVLGGGLYPRVSPRPIVEVAEAGDRVLYGAWLYRQQKAPRIICTGGLPPGSRDPQPEAEVMRELLEWINIPRQAVLTETASRNTHEHSMNLPGLFEQQGVKRVLLVTSALHMPRSIGVFRRSFPQIEFVPAPTDFRVEPSKGPWYMQFAELIPSPRRLGLFADIQHEYIGLIYYRLRGWI